MTDEEKLYQPYYQTDRLWIGNKAIKELYKIMSQSKKDIKPWLAKQALWQSSYVTSKGNKSSLLYDKA